MRGMFYYGVAFNQNLTRWSVAQVTKHSGFNTTSGLQDSYLPHFKD